jgi:hypothetical protein
MKRISSSALIAIIVLATAACSTVHKTYVPDGRRGYVVTCNGFLNSFADCLVKAGRACGSSGYETLKGGEDDRDLLIACNATHAPTQQPPLAQH